MKVEIYMSLYIYLLNVILILPASGLAMEAKASCDKSMVPRQPGGQKSTILTVTVPDPLQGWGSPWLVAPTHLTVYFFPQAPPLSQNASLAAAIITPSLE